MDDDDDLLLVFVLSPDGSQRRTNRRENCGESCSLSTAWQAVAFLCLDCGLAGCWKMQCHSSDFGLDSWRFNASGEGNGTGETLVVGTRLNKNDHWAPQLRIGTQQTRRPRRNGGGWCRALRTLVVDSRRPCAVSAHRPQDLLSPFAVVDHEAAINDASMLQYGWKRSTMGPSKTSEDQTGQLCDPAARLTPPKKKKSAACHSTLWRITIAAGSKVVEEFEDERGDTMFPVGNPRSATPSTQLARARQRSRSSGAEPAEKSRRAQDARHPHLKS